MESNIENIKKILITIAEKRAGDYNLSRDKTVQLLDDVDEIVARDLELEAKKTKVYSKAKAYYIAQYMEENLSEEDMNIVKDNSKCARDILDEFCHKISINVDRRLIAEARSVLGVKPTTVSKFEHSAYYEEEEVSSVGGEMCRKTIQYLKKKLKKGDRVIIKPKSEDLRTKELRSTGGRKVVEIEALYPNVFTARNKSGNKDRIESFQYFDVKAILRDTTSEDVKME